MNIWTKQGHEVKVTEESAKNGYPSDSDKVAKYLLLDVPYTVDYTVVHGWSSTVCLIEFPDIEFNTVNFEDYK